MGRNNLKASVKYQLLDKYILKVWNEEIGLDDISDSIPEELLERAQELISDLGLCDIGFIPDKSSGRVYTVMKGHYNYNDFRYVMSCVDIDIEWE